jgi:hypothetical protein
MKISHDAGSHSSNDGQQNPMDKLLAKLSEQTAALSKQQEVLKSSDDIAYTRTVEYVSAAVGSSIPAVPAFAPAATVETNNEVLRLKLELEAANGKIARMDQELQSRNDTLAESDFGYVPCKSTLNHFSHDS